MGLLDWLPWGGSRSSAAVPARAPAPTPDGAAFVRESTGADLGAFGRAGSGGPGALRLLAFAATAGGYVDEFTPPDQVPLELIESMRFDPWIYLGERMFAATLQDPTLYYVKHRDPQVRAEAEAWLAKLLPQLLRAVTRAFALGCSPYVLDWVAEDISFPVKREGGGSFSRTMRGHQHYAAKVHEIKLAEAQLEVLNDDLLGVRYAGRLYRADRAFAAVWDPEGGDWRGNGSRRRAWRAYYKGAMVSLLEGRWLERGVDPPRIGYAPNGVITIDGEEVSASELLTDALMALKGGDAAVLPSSFDSETNQRLWGVEPMQLPDVSKVWRGSIDATSAEKLLASMVPPSSAGVGDSTFAAARVPNEMFVELLESAASWVAEQVECVSDVVHAINHGSQSEPPEVEAREIPRRKVNRLADFARAVATVPRRVEGGKEVTLAELVDESILDEIGIARRPTSDAAREPRGGSSGPTGRPREATSERQDRRDAAREPEGEEATGAADEGIDA